MSSFSSSSSSSERPTLPPLHTLNLLPPSFAQHCRGDSPYDSSPRLHVPKRSWAYPRRVSMSSSSSSSTSRTPSPSPSDSSSSSSSTSPTSPKVKLVPCSFADADAVVVIPPPGAPGQGLLLTGPALAHLRHPQRQIAKGTRLHPYRFAAGRRASMASSVASTPV
ncbi:hypothetical protein C8F04DRAFT_1072148 [Mycena alexandri]|uniref:Uncharacterized protein n=1 Tax=Mycena alexandri TaxID=1745969 RepID=A0AAD6XB72_9AGAR|nr:hypothetical protein C8F04DRAFT_1072148 [Mycena alexandri]